MYLGIFIPIFSVLQDFRVNELELDFEGTKEYFDLLLDPIPLYPEIPKPVPTLREKQSMKEAPTGYTEQTIKEVLEKVGLLHLSFWITLCE